MDEIKKFITTLKKFNACEDSIEWLSKQDNLKQAWYNCERGDWLLWLVARLGIDKRKLFLAKGLGAKQVLHLMKDERSIAAVHAAINYGRGKISKDELKFFIADAYTAAAATYAADAYATYAAYAAAYAAASATATSATATYAAYTANATANAAAYATAYADDADDLSVSGKKLFLKKASEIIRQVFNFEEIEKCKHFSRH